TAALRVGFADPAGGPSWVQGTAVLIAPGLALTNRHVLFPPAGGLALARRYPGTTRAALKPSLDVVLDFAHDDGTPGRGPRLAVTGIAFVAAPADPVDAALLTVAGAVPAPLPVAADAPPDDLYVIGHPGRMAGVPDDIWQVFGMPDERKRLSFGRLMAVLGQDIVHDASTIGGYSGAAVSGFAAAEVCALHYWGDPEAGNRAITAAALRAHGVLGPMLP
ncbi:MAG: trypsin-like serine peptidase, partial [Gemmobacter sp.]